MTEIDELVTKARKRVEVVESETQKWITEQGRAHAYLAGLLQAKENQPREKEPKE